MTSKTSLFLILAILVLAAFPGAVPAIGSSGNQATFISADTSTRGNWKGTYGSDGYAIANNSQSIPSYATFAVQNQSNYTWVASTTDARALQTSSGTGRIASTWFSNTTFNFDLNLTDGNSHQIALYALDWDNSGGGRAERVQIVDANTNAVLAAQNISSFYNGIYLIWNISGHVKINVTLTGGGNAVISGVFFTGTTTQAGATAGFVGTDLATHGNWKGAYGSDGYAIANDSQSIPSYATFAVQNQLNWTWAASTSDARALQTGSGSGRIASTWYNGTSFNFDLNLTDGNSHQIGFYALDWDNVGRSERLQIVDANTNAVLDTENIFSFQNGIYLIWNITGHVKINVALTGPGNAVVGGVFFGNGNSSSTSTNSSSNTNSNPSTPSEPSTTPTTTTTTPTSNTTAALPSGLVLHWTFDTANITGTSVADISNNGGTGTIVGNASAVAGKINQALAFNGVNSYVSMPANLDPSTAFNNSITLAAWIKTTNTTRTESIISKFSAAGSASGYIFETDAAGHLELRVGAEDLYAYPAVVADTTATLNDGQWHHAAVVITMGKGAQFYVDGTATSSAAMTVWAGGDGSSNLEVGSCSYTPYAQYFTGSIDDVQVYNRALSSTEISTIFSSGGQAQSTQTTTTPPPTQNNSALGLVSVSPASFNFGSINIGKSVTQTFAVSNSGIATVTFSSVTISGAGLTASGVSNGTMLAPGQSATLTVTYAPASAVALNGGVTFVSNASNASFALGLTGLGLQAPPSSSSINAVTFLGIDTTTQGAWKGLGHFNANPPSSSFVYGKEGDILPDTEACDACNPFPAYVSFGPQGLNASTQGSLGSHPISTHASAALVQGVAAVMGPEPSNTGNTNYFQCNYTYSNAAIPWAPMVAWTPAVDTREISKWYTCAGITSFYLEFSFGNSTHNFEVYVVDDQNGGTALRSEEFQVLDGDTNAVLYDSGSFSNFTGGIYYKWSIAGHVKVKIINTSTNGTDAVVDGVFFN